MLREYLRQHSKHINRKLSKKDHDLEAITAYFELNLFMKQMQPLLKIYSRIIDEHPNVTSHLKTIPISTMKNYQGSDITTSSDNIAVDNSPILDKDTTDISCFRNLNECAAETCHILWPISSTSPLPLNTVTRNGH